MHDIEHEKSALDELVAKLSSHVEKTDFHESSTRTGTDYDPYEGVLLRRQLLAMQEYSRVLGERIERSAAR